MICVKICGITRPDDALLAARAGASAIGLVFYPPSPRAVDGGAARDIVDALPPFVTPVGLFVDAAVDLIVDCAHVVGFRTVQLHGDEPPRIAAELRMKRLAPIKAWRIGSESDVDDWLAWDREGSRYVAGYLLDSRSTKGRGGTGETFSWSLIKDRRPKRPIILAGGLTPENVARAVQAVSPWGVDVSSGVESSPGVKDAEVVSQFVARVRLED